MHAFVAATPAFVFQRVTASLPAGAANAARDRAAPGPGSWVNTPATRAVKTQPICHQFTAANVVTGTVVTLLRNLFERMRHMGSSLRRARCDPAPF
jgi:hypothetical protein